MVSKKKPNIPKADEIEHMMSIVGQQEIPVVTVDYFRQTVSLINEQMREIYSSLHEINMSKDFSTEIKFGDISVTIRGPENSSTRILKETKTVLGEMLTTFDKKSKEMKKERADARPTGYS